MHARPRTATRCGTAKHRLAGLRGCARSAKCALQPSCKLRSAHSEGPAGASLGLSRAADPRSPRCDQAAARHARPPAACSCAYRVRAPDPAPPPRPCHAPSRLACAAPLERTAATFCYRPRPRPGRVPAGFEPGRSPCALPLAGSEPRARRVPVFKKRPPLAGERTPRRAGRRAAGARGGGCIAIVPRGPEAAAGSRRGNESEKGRPGAGGAGRGDSRAPPPPSPVPKRPPICVYLYRWGMCHMHTQMCDVFITQCRPQQALIGPQPQRRVRFGAQGGRRRPQERAPRYRARAAARAVTPRCAGKGAACKAAPGLRGACRKPSAEARGAAHHCPPQSHAHVWSKGVVWQMI